MKLDLTARELALLAAFSPLLVGVLSETRIRPVCVLNSLAFSPLLVGVLSETVFVFEPTE